MSLKSPHGSSPPASNSSKESIGKEDDFPGASTNPNYSSPLTSKSGVYLIPRPTSDPNDPLNWSTTRKVKILSAVCLASYSANASALSGQLAYPRQAAVYDKTAIELSYSVSAALSGLAAGALFLVPLASLTGRSSLTFWSLLGCLGCAVWSALMTSEGDYIPFIISRLLSGMFASVPSAVGGGTIMDLFFLHDRGKAFICFEVCILLGATSGPTFCGFILQQQSWTVTFWWTVALLGVTAVAVFFLAEETNYDRRAEVAPKSAPRSFVGNRVATFLPGSAVTPLPSAGQFVKEAAAPFLIGLSPATMIIGLFTMINFGWHLLNDTLSPLFLQRSVAEGGYGFSPARNGAFTFSIWLGLLAAQVLGYFINDALPLYICRRHRGGVWQPELRLHVLWITVILIPAGLGIGGAALQYHAHYMVYALGVFVVAVGALLQVPVAANYVAETYTHFGTACTLVTTLYRLGWGVAIPFFIEDWIAEVGTGWVYGIAAFLTLATGALVAVLLWKGPVLRRLSLVRSLVSSEDGEAICPR